MVTPHPEQIPSLLEWVTNKSLQFNNAMIVDEPASDAAGPSTWLITLVNNTAVLLYEDETYLIDNDSSEPSSPLSGGGCKIVYNYLKTIVIIYYNNI